MAFSSNHFFSADEGSSDSRPPADRGNGPGNVPADRTGPGTDAGEPLQRFLVSELVPFVPPAILAQSGIPMEREVALPMPRDGSNEVRLSTLYQACPELFAAEITPLNDSTVPLPLRLGGSAAEKEKGAGEERLPSKGTSFQPTGFYPPLAGDRDAPASDQTDPALDNPFWAASARTAEEGPPESGANDAANEPPAPPAAGEDAAAGFADEPFQGSGGFDTLFSEQAREDGEIPYPGINVSGAGSGGSAPESEQTADFQGRRSDWPGETGGQMPAGLGAMFHDEKAEIAGPDTPTSAGHSTEAPWGGGDFSATPGSGEPIPAGFSPGSGPPPGPPGEEEASAPATGAEEEGNEGGVERSVESGASPESASGAEDASAEGTPHGEPHAAPESVTETASEPAPMGLFEPLGEAPAKSSAWEGPPEPEGEPAPEPGAEPTPTTPFEPVEEAPAESPATAPREEAYPGLVSVRETTRADALASKAADAGAAPPAPPNRDAEERDVELRALFSTDESFTLASVARRIAELPGIEGCALATPTKRVQATSAAGGDGTGEEAHDMVQSARSLAAFTGVPGAKSFTVHTDRGTVTLFLEGDCCLSVNHEGGTFAPGVREKLILIARSIHKLEG